jgi:Tol biopolymer transport system component
VISSCLSEAGQPLVATPTTPPDEYEYFPTAIPTNSAKIPVTWASLNLTGKFVFSMGAVDKDNNFIVQIQVLDLATGKITVAYRAPLNGWIYYVSVSPDAKQIVMSYSPPTGENPNIVQALYVLPLDGSKPPELLFMPPTPADQYFQTEWSPDGRYIYYTHVNYRIPEDPNRLSPLYKIFRMAYPGGQPELIAEGAYWPRLAADSSRLVYVSVDPLSIKNKLIVVNPDGGNAQEVVMTGPYIPDIKNSPIFSPDGQSILFSGVAPIPPQSYQPNWFEKLSGIRVAKAEGEPSDWWSVPVSGGEITQLTNIRHRGLYASIAPDNQYIAIFSKDNIFVMKPDGSELTILISELHGFSGTLSWIP